MTEPQRLSATGIIDRLGCKRCQMKLYQIASLATILINLLIKDILLNCRPSNIRSLHMHGVRCSVFLLLSVCSLGSQSVWGPKTLLLKKGLEHLRPKNFAGKGCKEAQNKAQRAFDNDLNFAALSEPFMLMVSYSEKEL